MAEEGKLEIPEQPATRNAVADLIDFDNIQTLYRSPYVPDSYESPYNPDDLWKKTGGFETYDKMMNDDQISICMRIKKDLVIGSGFDFVTTDEGQEEVQEWLEEAFGNSCQFPFEERLEEILTAYENGFSITEKVYTIGEGGMAEVKDLLTRHPNGWRLYQDESGYVSKYEQLTDKSFKEIPKSSLIHYTVNQKYQNPYGKSDLRQAYEAWFIKREVVKYFAIFMEKAASPFPVAKYDKNAPQAAVDDLFNIIKKIQARTALVIPKDIEVEFVQASNTGDAYHKAMGIFNMMIGRALFIPDLMGFSGSETGGGSYSLGKEQMAVFFMHVNRRRRALENIVNRQIIAPLISYNFGLIKAPTFKIKPIDDMQAVELAKLWLEAVKGRAYKANDEEINHFRKLVKFPEGEVERSEPVVPGFQPTGEEPEKEEPEDTEEEVEKEVVAKKFTARGKTDYEKKVDFKMMKQKFADYDNSIMVEVGPVITKIVNDLNNQIEKKRILENQNLSKAEGLRVKYLGELNKLLKGSFTGIYRDAQSIAAKELNKGNYKAPLPNKKFLEMLDEETWNYLGDYEYTILKRVRQELVKGIKDGTPLSEVQGILSNELEKLSEVSIERYARTKHTEVMNRGRHAYFEDSGVVAAYQYSAIIDDVTSELCAALDEKIFAAGDEPIPPLHFNCRSLLVPITKYESFKADTKIGKQDIQDYIEENKGGGFATK